jgi:Recombination endonuclease VII
MEQAQVIKKCPSCDKEKSLFDFAIRQSGPRIGQPVAHCKACNVEKQRERKVKDPTVYRRIEWPSKLRRTYGITVDDYYKMLENQGGGCAICGTRVPSQRKRKYVSVEMFFVDHCHATGKVRGLLCSRCNRGIGYFDDNPGRLEMAAAYLKES